MTNYERIRKLVHERLDGDLLAFELVESNDRELAYIIRWWRQSSYRLEYGTHRCLLDMENGPGGDLLIWGHYISGPEAQKEALKDYLERVARYATTD